MPHALRTFCPSRTLASLAEQPARCGRGAGVAFFCLFCVPESFCAIFRALKFTCSSTRPRMYSSMCTHVRTYEKANESADELCVSACLRLCFLAYALKRSYECSSREHNYISRRRADSTRALLCRVAAGSGVGKGKCIARRAPPPHRRRRISRSSSSNQAVFFLFGKESQKTAVAGAPFGAKNLRPENQAIFLVPFPPYHLLVLVLFHLISHQSGFFISTRIFLPCLLSSRRHACMMMVMCPD